MQQLNGAYYAGPTNIQKQNADQRWQQVPEKQRCQVNREEWAEYEEIRLQEKRTKIRKKRSKLLKKAKQIAKKRSEAPKKAKTKRKSRSKVLKLERTAQKAVQMRSEALKMR